MFVYIFVLNDELQNQFSFDLDINDKQRNFCNIPLLLCTINSLVVQKHILTLVFICDEEKYIEIINPFVLSFCLTI